MCDEAFEESVIKCEHGELIFFAVGVDAKRSLLGSGEMMNRI